MQAHKFKFPRTAHYYTLGRANKSVKYFWIVCHGYGQLAKKFIYKFDDLIDDENFILAPEGFSRFYLDNVSGRPVGTSWMTREDRLDEIDDYANLLQHYYDQYLPQFSDDVKIILLGFSQGCATQVRWMMEKFPRFDHLILWAGFFPEDLNYIPHKDYYSDKSIHFVYGTEDQYLTPERLQWHEQLMKDQELVVSQYTFEGPHRIDRVKLKELAEKLKA